MLVIDMIKEHNKSLAWYRDEFEVHERASANMNYNARMREVARAKVKSTNEKIKLLEATIDALELIKERE